MGPWMGYNFTAPRALPQHHLICPACHDVVSQIAGAWAVFACVHEVAHAHANSLAVAAEHATGPTVGA